MTTKGGKGVWWRMDVKGRGMKTVGVGKVIPYKGKDGVQNQIQDGARSRTPTLL